jgi:hypothetical protein
MRKRELSMAGRVSCHFTVGRDSESWTIDPDICPVADQHRRDAVDEDSQLAPRCQSFAYGFGRRTCPYWYATTGNSNAANRLDGSMLHQDAMARGVSQIRCGVLCMGARRNRPPGV